TPSGSNTITLLLPIFNTANPGLSITGSGNALIINKGAILKNSSGAIAGSGIAIAGTFRINNGGRYIHNTARGNSTIVTQLSAAAGTETGVFEYDVPVASYIISLTGRTYGTLELSSQANAGIVSYGGNGSSPARIMGDLKINSGVSLNISMSADFIVQKNYIQSSSSTFNIQSATANNIVRIGGNIFSQGKITKSGTGLPVLETNGAVSQDISMTGLFTGNIVFRINNATGINLLSPLAIPFNLQLMNGKIKTSATNMLIMADNSIAIGGSGNSFIEGPMKKGGDDPFVFPVGKGSIYAPVSFNSTGMSVTDTFMSEYIRANPQSVYGINYETVTPPYQFNHISYVEYWMLRKTSGASLPLTITLPVTAYSFSRNLDSTFITKYNTTDMQWKTGGASLANAGLPSPPYVTGTITSALFSGDGIFTFYTNSTYAENPLPVKIISFNGSIIDNRKALLQWEIADDDEAISSIEIQRAGSNHHFVTIGSVVSNPGSRLYKYEDNGLLNGINYFCLKLINRNSSVMYSRVMTIKNGSSNLELLSLSPSVVNNTARLAIRSAFQSAVTIVITDIQGQLISQHKEFLIGGDNNISLQLTDLKPGPYMIWGVYNEERTNVLRFVKE
ncbi:MAG: hypothetical protein ABI480_11950, partial [Chitinophagaceae bacterium]